MNFALGHYCLQVILESSEAIADCRQASGLPNFKNVSSPKIWLIVKNGAIALDRFVTLLGISSSLLATKRKK